MECCNNYSNKKCQWLRSHREWSFIGVRNDQIWTVYKLKSARISNLPVGRQMYGGGAHVGIVVLS